jgi:hypothetical protein
MVLDDLLGANGIGGSNNNLIIWVVVLVLIFGFGNGRNMFNLNFSQCEPKEGCCSSHGKHKRRYSSDCSCSDNLNMGQNGINNGFGFGRIIGNNGLFIAAVVLLLFLCREKESEPESSNEQ